MRSIAYPNAIDDLVVIEFRGGSRIGFLVRPVEAGLFRIVLWPEGLPDPDLAMDALIELPSSGGPPAHVAVDLAGYHGRAFATWSWALMRTQVNWSRLHDLGRALIGTDVIARNRFTVPGSHSASSARFVAWSCHQPYQSANETRAVLQGDALEILKWYSDLVREFRPDVVWGQGDTAYSDGTEATDFSNQVYDKGRWFTNPEATSWLRDEYRRMYRHFWSLEPMREVMSHFPHIFIWDDHEIHDGWGSEGKDRETGNLEMFRIAHQVANEYILNAGPRVRPQGAEAHQGYVMGPMAGFLFDTRSTRNYEGTRDRLISRQQLDDFVAFLDLVGRRAEVTNLVTCTSVPLVGLLTWATSVASRAPELLNDVALSGVRDDVRDSWTSPGNMEALNALLSEIRRFMVRRPDIRITNISGDIHVANAFELHIPGAPAPIHQLTTSAITNREHAPELVALITEIGDEEYIDGVGAVRRLWDTVTAPNALFADLSATKAAFTLRVWDPAAQGSRDLSLNL
jgi:hypothetical protein